MARRRAMPISPIPIAVASQVNPLTANCRSHSWMTTADRPRSTRNSVTSTRTMPDPPAVDRTDQHRDDEVGRDRGLVGSGEDCERGDHAALEHRHRGLGQPGGHRQGLGAGCRQDDEEGTVEISLPGHRGERGQGSNGEHPGREGDPSDIGHTQSLPEKLFMIWIPAGPSTATKRQGRMQKISGTRILTGTFCAASSAH